MKKLPHPLPSLDLNSATWVMAVLSSTAMRFLA
ncbi:hypothetical protein X753_00105 [Mesorhizobium sp. LNJC399B00]|nr:hypothetical protein X753_00105 [Mesorhizobium sp. LNJC399B00]